MQIRPDSEPTAQHAPPAHFAGLRARRLDSKSSNTTSDEREEHNTHQNRANNEVYLRRFPGKRRGDDSANRATTGGICRRQNHSPKRDREEPDRDRVYQWPVTT